jgi:hypothetical protein
MSRDGTGARAAQLLTPGRVAAVGVLVVWALVCRSRVGVLFEAPAEPIAQEIAPFAAFARGVLPPDARYFFPDGSVYAADPAIGPRLRYELAPRNYADASAALPEAEVQAMLRADDRDYVVMPTLRGYSPDAWYTRELAWFDRVPFAPDAFVLVVRDPNAPRPADTATPEELMRRRPGESLAAYEQRLRDLAAQDRIPAGPGGATIREAVERERQREDAGAGR